MPWIDEREGGFVVRWREGGRGTRPLTSDVFPNRREATRELEAVRQRLKDRKPVRAGGTATLAQIVANWEASRIALGNDPLHTSTAARRLRWLLKSRKWERIADVTKLAIQDWRAAKGSPRAGAMLGGLLRYARDVLDQPVNDGVLAMLKPPRAKRKAKRPLLSAAEVDAYVARAAALSLSAGALTRCLATYGWRPITAARMVVADLDPFRRLIRQSVKGGDVVEHPMPADVAGHLAGLVLGAEPTAPLFLDPRTGKGWDLGGTYGISQWCRDHLSPLRIYDLKRFAITTMLGLGIPPQDICLFTGHRTKAQVLTYAVTNEERAQLALAKIHGAPESTERTQAHRNAISRGTVTPG